MLADIKSRPGFASNLLIAPAGFWPEEASLEYSIRILTQGKSRFAHNRLARWHREL